MQLDAVEVNIDGDGAELDVVVGREVLKGFRLKKRVRLTMVMALVFPLLGVASSWTPPTLKALDDEVNGQSTVPTAERRGTL